jgi:hypothetical protein
LRARVDGDVQVYKNLDVSFEIVSPVKDVDFTALLLKTAEVKGTSKSDRETRTNFFSLFADT